jgi:peptidyl-prolyl cis-trans isomerase C
LLQEARRLGVVAEPSSDEEGRSEVGDDATIRALLEEEVVPAEPGDSECLRYYQANENRFRTPELFEAAHILIEPEGDTEQAWETALDRARRIVGQVGDSADAFAASARANSSCPSAQQDGSLGQIRRGELVPEVQAGLEALAEGSTARDLIRSRFVGSKAAPSRSTSYATGSPTCLKRAAGRSKRRATWLRSLPGTRSRAC